MSETLLAAKLASDWDELSRDSVINRENYIRSLLLIFKAHVLSEFAAQQQQISTAASSLKNSDADNAGPAEATFRHQTPVDQSSGAVGSTNPTTP